MTIDEIALDAARKIEQLIAQKHRGGAVQRQARIQCVVIDALNELRGTVEPLRSAAKATVNALTAEHNIPEDASDDWIYDVLGSAVSGAFFAARDALKGRP